ncbi:MAG TPA: hypothetical protein VM307_00030, partial [Egibacteraceae bacterium]|nr:hypothetical protein [Egibacteraceae bacterium]
MNPRRPASRRKVLLWAAFAGLVIAGIVAGAEALRYPHPTDTAVTAPDPQETEVATDIRDPVECPEPLPREGQEREGGTPGGISRRTSNELYDCPEFYDEQRIRYRGEVVGAVLRRDEGAWVH